MTRKGFDNDDKNKKQDGDGKSSRDNSASKDFEPIKT